MTIRGAMWAIWGIQFEPTQEWVERIRAEVVQMRAGKRADVRAAQVAEREEKARGDKAKAPVQGLRSAPLRRLWWRCPECWDELRKSEF
jgi:hypothetical protein